MSREYQVFVIDPPWDKKKGGIRKVRPSQGRELNYKTMKPSEIFQLLDIDVFSKAENNHCVFMWAIEQYLSESDVFMFSRGYKRHCRFVWDKTNGVAPAFTVRFSHEYLVWYYKEKMIPISKDARGRHKTIFSEKAREHSRKPDISYKIIESLYPDSLKLDVFSREKRVGWDQYGDQVNFFQ